MRTRVRDVLAMLGLVVGMMSAVVMVPPEASVLWGTEATAAASPGEAGDAATPPPGEEQAAPQGEEQAAPGGSEAGPFTGAYAGALLLIWTNLSVLVGLLLVAAAILGTLAFQELRVHRKRRRGAQCGQCGRDRLRGLAFCAACGVH